ncbi:Hypothetical protein R9X50_00358700 [Acrodontium crateriforme]|uniref:Uncharacterized protein n=1 Tax=Acrodontium crateriforme TaxID=150365 RepID=A0AAQ3M4D3_9PEZI|nr:Hypothetical protein R9X50_00358700 [Acrodontium crateriforme]
MAVGGSSWVGQPRIRGSTESMQMILLTFSMIGLQFAWGTETIYGSPYLLNLGLSKSDLSLVWVAGPLSGLVMQPIIGMVSDSSKSKYGRRRPFMIGGAVAVCICMLILGWASEIIGLFVADEARIRQNAIRLAVVDIYVLDFVINISQSTCRALVVDTLPVEKQQLGSAWVSRMSGVGQLLIYGIGSLDLKRMMGNFLGESQFKKLCIVTAFTMLSTQGLTCWMVQERVLVADGRASDSNGGLMSVLTQIYSTTRNLPESIQAICRVQFWSWIGYFPFLFYGSTWVGEIYLRNAGPSENDALTEVGRAGSVAFIAFAITSFASSIVMPWIIKSPEDDQGQSFTPRPPAVLSPFLRKYKPTKPTLLTAWACGNLMFAASMVFAPFVTSVHFATILIALCGIPWAVAGWAPGTFLGIEVNRMSSSIPLSMSARRMSNDSIEMDSRSSSPLALHLRHDSGSSAIDTTSTGELSGIYFGILNIYTTLPQFVGTGISWVVFSILEPGKSRELTTPGGSDGLNSKNGLSGIGVCLCIGAVSAVVAAWATRRLKHV